MTSPTPKVLAEAGQALPRPVKSEEALKVAALLPAFDIAGLGKSVAADACDMLRALVSERDELASRVRELEAALQGCIDYGSMTGDDWVIDKARVALTANTSGADHE